MKVKDLIIELSKQDPEKEVMIQQGQDFDYSTVYTVKEKELVDIDSFEENDTLNAVVIEYT